MRDACLGSTGVTSHPLPASCSQRVRIGRARRRRAQTRSAVPQCMRSPQGQWGGQCAWPARRAPSRGSRLVSLYLVYKRNQNESRKVTKRVRY